MFAVCLEDVFVEHQTVDNGEDAVDAIDCEKDDVTEITGCKNEFSEGEEDYKGYRYCTDVSGEAFGFFAEVEEVKNHHRYSGNIQKYWINKWQFVIYPCKCKQQNQAVSAGNAVYSIHEVVGVNYTCKYYQCNDTVPERECSK